MLTQAEANELYQGPEIDMANVWANVFNLIMTSLFFHPLLPVSIPIGFFGLLVTYWTDKVSKLRLMCAVCVP